MSTPQNGSPSSASPYRHYASAAVSLVCGGVITLAVFWTAYSFEQSSSHRDFNALADARFQAIDNVFEQFSRLVAFADNVFMVAPSASSPAFPDYVRSLKRFLEKDQAQYAAIDAITWVPRVPANEADAFQLAARAVIDPRFEIQRSAAGAETGSDSRREASFPSYLSVGMPFHTVKPGQDVARDPDAWKAMQRACDTGRLVAMSPVRTSNKAEDRFGYRVFQPLYRDGDPGDVLRRRQTNVGFLCLDLDAGVLVGKAFEDLRPVGIDLWVVDSTDGKDSVLCRHSSRLSLPVKGEREAFRQPRGQFVTESTKRLFGRDVGLYGVSTPAFWSGRAVWQPWVILCVGFALTVAATGFRHNLAIRAAAIDRAVETRIDSLRVEREQHDAKRQQSRHLSNSPPDDRPRQSPLGAPIDTNESQPTDGFNAGVPE